MIFWMKTHPGTVLLVFGAAYILSIAVILLVITAGADDEHKEPL